MKTSIPSDVWEKKKALIAKLYKEEEWPLKQVIKQIRTDDFNPSETQLRSRLKKWRVTKPSRQTRKKSQDDSQEAGADEDDVEETTPEEPTVASSIPQHQPPTQTSPESNTNSAEWYGTNNSWVNPPQPPPPPPLSQQTNLIHQSALNSSVSFSVQEPGHSWGSSSSPESLPSAQETQNLPKQHPVSVPTSMQPYSMVPPSPHASNTFTPQQQNSASQAMMTAASTPMVNQSFSHHQYPISPETCTPSPAAMHNVQWSGRTNFIEADMNNSLSAWFPQPYDNFQSSTAYPFYVQNPANSSIAGYGPMIQPFPLHDLNHGMAQPIMAPDGFDLYEDYGDVNVKPWRRAMASHESPEAANGHARVDRQGRQRKALIEKKMKEMTNEPAVEGIDQHQRMPAQYIPQAPSVVHPEMYGYPGH